MTQLWALVRALLVKNVQKSIESTFCKTKLLISWDPSVEVVLKTQENTPKFSDKFYDWLKH